MTSVNLPSDDAALRTTHSSPTRTVNETQPYPATQAVQAHEETPSTPPQRINRNQRQRRKHERRQKNLPVLLDTRSGRDRRNAINRQHSKDDTRISGIDVYS